MAGLTRLRLNTVLQLGDDIEAALTKVGLTKETVEAWLGRPCACKERQDSLNRLSEWASRILKGKTENALGYLRETFDSIVTAVGNIT